ncbi:radical SAM protein [Sulfoacidibacillus thermotolerans]|uniref:Radical SAM core domain-containing protein n=1 Tax=Sulfoacidibacillus thermotolerans TaxID=1765684 RepID=A0A2U3D6H9_SULT2|nr:radical SAM protein [Sulfoacidibacillus thermotolerans]PWI56888.1 hypothetical protein BM613_11230 [Sulfoacidibacillus thermotolerans]
MSHNDEFTVRVQHDKLRVRQADKQYLFDRSGRFLLYATDGQVIRRGLDHRMLKIDVPRYGGLPARRYTEMTREAKAQFLETAYVLAKTALRQAQGAEIEYFRAIFSTISIEQLEQDAKAFLQVYLPVSILPPDQYHTLVVQVTHGCSYNRCLFCDFYRDRPFHIKSRTELQSHLKQLQEFFGERMRDRTGVFLGDGNALVIPTERLVEMIQLMKEKLGNPVTDTFSTFMDTFTLDHKSQAELQRIREIGLETVYIGFETGADRLRAFLDKPGTADEAVQAVIKLKTAGFRIGLILLIGAGGDEFVKEHREQTIKALARIPFTAGDVVFLSPFYMPEHTPYEQKMEQAKFQALSEVAMEQELLFWKAQLSLLYPAKITLYSIKEHIY